MPTIPNHHLYDIHICHYSSPCCRRFLPLFSHILSCLPFAFSCRCYFAILLSLRVGPSIAVSRTNGPGFATFSFLSAILRTLLARLGSLFYGTHLLFAFDNTCRVRVRVLHLSIGLSSRSCPISSLRLNWFLLSCPLPRFLRFPVCNCHVVDRNGVVFYPIYPSPSSSERSRSYCMIPALFVFASWGLSFCVRAIMPVLSFCMKPNRPCTHTSRVTEPGALFLVFWPGRARGCEVKVETAWIAQCVPNTNQLTLTSPCRSSGNR